MPEVPLSTHPQSHDLFHSFCRHPQLTFESQHEHEIVALTLRAHPFTQLGWVSATIAGILLPLVFDAILIGRAPATTIIFLNIFWWAIVLSFAFYNLLRWIFNVGIITNERVLDVDYFFIQKVITEAADYDITDVTARTTGFFPNLLNYGDVLIQTAGTHQNVEFLQVPQPNEAVKVISQFAQESHGNN